MRYRSLIEALAAAPAEKPFVTMWHDEDSEDHITFGEFRLQAERYAQRFAAEGLECGSRVILIMEQGIALMAAFAGAMLLGAVPAILAYPNFKVEPNKYRLGLTGVTANLKAQLIVIDEAFPDEFQDHVTVGANTRLIRGLKGPIIAPTWANPDPNSIAFIQHSAGSTGLQKGVALSHAAVLRQLDHLAETLRVTEHDVVYSWLPLYHDMGLIACFMLPMALHLPVVMQSPTTWVMQPGTMLELISRYRCTLAWIPNFTLQLLARRVPADDLEGIDLSSLRALVNCSEPIRAQSEAEFISAYRDLGLRSEALHTSYAMAENVFAVTQSTVDGARPGPHRISIDPESMRWEHRAVPVEEGNTTGVAVVSSGPCLPNNEVRIVSSEGKDLRVGEVGEILVRSDSLFEGYFNRPDLTAAAIREGWYWTGDIGFLLDGELYVTGRKRDLIIVGGKNIYPQDVEAIVSSHGVIHDGRAVAFGILNPDLGTEDIVVAAEAEREQDLALASSVEREIRSAVLAELGVAVRAVYLKPPKWIVKSTAGKPARSATRDKLLLEHPELAVSQHAVAQMA